MSQKIRPKRSAVTDSSVSPENKKQCWELTDNLGIDINKQFHKMSSLDSSCGEDANSVSDGQTVSVSQNVEDNSSFGDDLEDSGIEIKSYADQTIVRRSGVPGFCLVQQCKSSPKPNFDHAQTDTAQVTKSQDDVDGQAVDKNSSNSKDKKRSSEKPETVVTEVSKHDAEWEYDSKIVDKNTQGNAETETISEKPQTVVADSLKPYVGLDKSCVVPDVSVTSFKVKCKDLIETPSQPAFCVSPDNEGMLTAVNEEAASNKDQTLKTAGEKKSACAVSDPPGLKTNLVSARTEERLTKTKNATANGAVQKQGNSSKGLDKVSSTSRHKQTPLSDTKNRKRAQDAKFASDCQTASNSSSKKKKSIPVKDSPKQVVLLSEKAKENVVRGDSRVSGIKKSKRSVLPAALLDGVVKTVQINVRTISTQVVAASAEKPPAAATKSCTTSDTGASSKCTVKDPVSVNTVDKPKESASVRNKAAKVTSNSSDTKVDGTNKSSKGRQKDKRQKTADKTASSKSKLPHNDSVKPSSETVKQTKPKSESGELEKDRGLLAELPMECVETDSSREAKPRNNKARTKKSSAQTSQSKLDQSDYESENARLLSALPGYIPENDSSLKPKKTRKKRKSAGGSNQASENISLLSVMPAYIPENDSRLKRRKQDRVYNLLELFAGTLGEGQSQEKRKRPNYFYAIQITSSVIKENLSTVLKEVEEAEPRLKPAFVPVETAHITLAVVHLADQEAIDRAKAGLDDFLSLQQQQQQEQNKEEIEIPQASADPLTLEVRGLGHFNDNVVFAKVAEGESLERLQVIADSLRSSVLKQNIPVEDKGFEAHLTIMKHSKNPKKLKNSGIRKISKEVYKESTDKMFGTELVASVQLCSMLKPKKNNYYHIEYSVSLFDVPGSEGLTTTVDDAGPVAGDSKELPADDSKGHAANESKEPTADKGLTADDDRGSLTGDDRTLSIDDDNGSGDGKALLVDDNKEIGDGKALAIDEDKGLLTQDGKTFSIVDDKEHLVDVAKTLSVDDDKDDDDGDGKTVPADDDKESGDDKALSADDGKETGDGKTLTTDEDKGSFTVDCKAHSIGDDEEPLIGDGRILPAHDDIKTGDGKLLSVDDDKEQLTDDGKTLLVDDDKEYLTGGSKTFLVDDDKELLNDYGKTLSFDENKETGNGKTLPTNDDKETGDGKTPSVNDNKETGDGKTPSAYYDEEPLADDGDVPPSNDGEVPSTDCSKGEHIQRLTTSVSEESKTNHGKKSSTADAGGDTTGFG